MTDPGEVAEAVAFLQSTPVGRITGQTLVVDGGFISSALIRLLPSSVDEPLVAAHPEHRLSGYVRDLVERERRTPDLPGRETTDRAWQPHGGCVVVDINDNALQASEVSRADRLVDSYFIAHAQDGEGRSGADRVQQPPARIDSLRQRGEVIVEVTVGDRIEQRSSRGEIRRWPDVVASVCP